MTPQEFKTLRGDHTLSELSRMIGVTTRTIRRYEDGTRAIGKPVQKLMAIIGGLPCGLDMAIKRLEFGGAYEERRSDVGCVLRAAVVLREGLIKS